MNQKQNCVTYSKTITRRASAFTKLAQHCTKVDKNHVLPSSKTFTFKIRPMKNTSFILHENTSYITSYQKFCTHPYGLKKEKLENSMSGLTNRDNEM